MNALSAVLVKLLLGFCALLPLAWARALGRLAARIYWPVGGRSRKVTQRNIEIAFPQLSAHEQTQLARRSLCSTGETITEMGHIWMRSWQHVESLIIEVTGDDMIRESLAEGRGIIGLGPHLGNWEVAGLHLATLGQTVTLYEPPKLKSLGPLIEAARQHSGAILVPTDSRGLVRLVRNVKAGNISAILPDQAPDDVSAGENSLFMGAPCFTGTLASNMIRRSGAIAVFGYAKRVPGGFAIHYLPAEEAVYSEDIHESLAAINRGVQRCVEQCVEQYQWEYKRFRVRPRSGPGVYDDL